VSCASFIGFFALGLSASRAVVHSASCLSASPVRLDRLESVGAGLGVASDSHTTSESALCAFVFVVRQVASPPAAARAKERYPSGGHDSTVDHSGEITKAEASPRPVTFG